jgi:hypothetical protein
MIVARALKNSQLTCGERHAYFGDRTQGYFDIAPSALNPERRAINVQTPGNWLTSSGSCILRGVKLLLN